MITRSTRLKKPVDYTFGQLLREETYRKPNLIYESPSCVHWKWPVGWGRSTIKTAGFGLFAIRDILKNEYVCTYEGYKLSFKQYKLGKYKSAYIMIHNNLGNLTDAADFNSCMGRFINDSHDNTLYNVETECTNNHLMIKANESVRKGFEMFMPYGSQYEWHNNALQRRADLVLYIDDVNTTTGNDSLISENDDTNFDNLSFKPSMQLDDTTDTTTSHLFANTQPPAKSSRVIADSSKCHPPVFLVGGGKRKYNVECDTKDDIPVIKGRPSLNAFLTSNFNLVAGEPSNGDCAFDAVRMSFATIVLRYPKAFNMEYCESVDLSISGMREQLSNLIRTNALYNASHAIDWNMTEHSYRSIVSYMFQYDPYNRTGGYAKQQDESEIAWLIRASEGLRTSELTATEDKPCVWISKEIATMFTRFYLIRAIHNVLDIPSMINYHDTHRFANPSRDASIVINDYQIGYSILHTSNVHLRDTNVQQLALAHDCMVVFTEVFSSTSADLQLFGSGHYKTYIKQIPIDAHKAAGLISPNQWKTFVSHIREYGRIPRQRIYTPFQGIHIVNSIVGSKLAKFVNPEPKPEPFSDVIDELISLNQTELRHTTDKNLVKLFMANIKVFEKLNGKSFCDSAESLSDVKEILNYPTHKLNVENSPQLIERAVQVSTDTTSVPITSDCGQQLNYNNITMSTVPQQYIGDPKLTWRGEGRKRLKNAKTDNDISVASVSDSLGQMGWTDQLTISNYQGMDNTQNTINILGESISKSTPDSMAMNTMTVKVDDENSTYLKAKKFFKILDDTSDKLTSGMRKKYKIKYKKYLSKYGDLGGKTIDDFPREQN
jgi:hypothetical protein